MDPIPVIDLFAGPGGMSEGFSSLRDENDEPVFRSIMSIEMERTAHATLRLRAFARRLMDADGRLPQDYIDYLGTPSSENLERLKDSHPEEWAAAEAEAIQGTLKEGEHPQAGYACEKRRISKMGVIPETVCLVCSRRLRQHSSDCCCRIRTG